MIHFNNCGQTYLFPILIFCVVSISLLMLNIQVELVHATITNTTETRVPVYEITTRGNLVSAQGINGSGYRDTYQLLDIRNLNYTCPEEVTIFVHGWGQNETEAKERLDRVKMSLEKYNYSSPLQTILFILSVWFSLIHIKSVSKLITNRRTNGHV
jgi:hypothetical protein